MTVPEHQELMRIIAALTDRNVSISELLTQASRMVNNCGWDAFGLILPRGHFDQQVDRIAGPFHSRPLSHDLSLLTDLPAFAAATICSELGQERGYHDWISLDQPGLCTINLEGASDRSDIVIRSATLLPNVAPDRVDPQGMVLLSTFEHQSLGQLTFNIELLYAAALIVMTRLAQSVRSQRDQVYATLTHRQKQIAQKIIHGVPNKNIALELGISEPAVSGHIKRLKVAFGVVTSRELQSALISIKF